MTRAAIIAAFPGELKPLVRHWQPQKLGSVDLWRWSYFDQKGEPGEWIAACAGAGTDAATRAFAAAEQAALQPLTSSQIAPQQSPPEQHQSEQPIHPADFDPDSQADPRSDANTNALAIPEPGPKSSPIDIVLSVGWAGAMHSVLEPGLAYSVAGVIDVRTGEMAPAAEWRDDVWLVTSPIVADEQEKRRLRAAYSAGLVDMEASAIARLALMRNLPFYCVKGVSDALDDNLPDFNHFLSPTGQLNLPRFTLFALLHPRYWPSLLRMGENSKKAAEGIAKLVLDILDPRGVIRTHNGYPDRKR